MSERIIQADCVYPMSSEALKKGGIVINRDHSIAAVLQEDEVPETAVFYNGVLCPGFVNAHCHLELSHLKSKIPQHTGLPGFIRHLQAMREAEEEMIIEAAAKADKAMWNHGIQAVGDISNTGVCFSVKSNSRINYHTFIEVFSLDPRRSEATMARATAMKERYLKNVNNRCSLVPHAPYSLSDQLFAALRTEQDGEHPVCMHNQETASEDLMFVSGEGDLYAFIRPFFTSEDPFIPTGKSSMVTTLPKLNPEGGYLLVHNTFTSADDRLVAENYFENGMFWCLCPMANQYIEGCCPDALPEPGMDHICIGTDSLASNTELSVLEELKLLQRLHGDIGADQLLRWGTYGGANALRMLPEVGCFKKNSKPGVLLIQNIVDNKLTKQSTLQRLA